MLWYEYPSTADYSYVNSDQAIGVHQETNPDVCVGGPVSTPLLNGTGVFKLCQPLLFPSSNHSCTQVLTFLHGRRSFCSGTAPEGKLEGAYQSSKRAWNMQHKSGSEPFACSLWEWFNWFLLSAWVKGCLFSLTVAWMFLLVGGDLFSCGCWLRRHA